MVLGLLSAAVLAPKKKRCRSQVASGGLRLHPGSLPWGAEGFIASWVIRKLEPPTLTPNP